MSSHFSPESEGSTSDSNERVTESSANAKPTRTPGKSSGDTGPTSRSTKTSQDLTPNGWTGFDDYNFQETGRITQTLRTESAGLVFEGSPTSSPEVSPAKTSPSPEGGQDSQANAPDCSSRPPESLTLFSEMEDGFSLRMFPDSFPQMAELTSGSFSRRWPNSGFTTSLGECWTADTSECHNDGGAFSSLPDVLEADVPPRFYLSPRAAAGIIRRAEKRGKALPPHLESALRELSAASVEDSEPQTRTDKEHSSPTHSKQQPETTQEQTDSTWSPRVFTQNTRDEVQYIGEKGEGSHTGALAAQAGMKQTNYLHSRQIIRRLTPTECERLQGFPDGWTIPFGDGKTR